MSIEWSNSLATGVTEIDDQHREIFNRVNRLSEACSEGKGKEEERREVEREKCKEFTLQWSLLFLFNFKRK